MQAIRRACADASAINSELLSYLQDPILEISLAIRIATSDVKLPLEQLRVGQRAH